MLESEEGWEEKELEAFVLYCCILLVWCGVKKGRYVGEGKENVVYPDILLMITGIIVISHHRADNS